jgi:hypothetical protein
MNVGLASVYRYVPLRIRTKEERLSDPNEKWDSTAALLGTSSIHVVQNQINNQYSE